MKEEQLKEYETNLVRLKGFSNGIGVDFAYIDSRGSIVLSSGDSTKLENLIIVNMYRQDAFANAVLKAVGFYFSQQEDMKDSVIRMREVDASNVAKDLAKRVQQAAEDLAKLIDLNDNEKESIKTYSQGEALFVCGNRRMRINVIATPEELSSFGSGGGL